MRINLQNWLCVRAAQAVEKSTQHLSPNSTLSVLFYSVKNVRHVSHYRHHVSQCIVTTISKLQEEATAAAAK